MSDEANPPENPDEATASEAAPDASPTPDEPVVEETWAKPERNVLLGGIIIINTILVLFILINQNKLLDRETEYLKEFFIQPFDSSINNDLKEKLYELMPVTANLKDWKGPRRYLRMSAVLQLNDDGDKEEVEAVAIDIKNEIISLINLKDPRDVTAEGGIENFKKGMKQSINKLLKKTKVEKIFFQEFRVN